MTNILI